MTSSLAFLFPGQGSQIVGMGKSLYQAEEIARSLFEEADAILGRFLSKMCFEGPEDLLRDTEITQPALFVCSAAACDVLRARGVTPVFVAGHSLGEYSALYAAGVVDFETGLRLVAARGKAMAEAGRQNPGAMAAVMGLEIEALDAVCRDASNDAGLVVVANDNSPGQTVISGSREGVDKACELARAAGAKRAVPLPVSGAFHSPLVEPARRIMETELARAELRTPCCVFIPNVSAKPETDTEAIRRGLVEQITGRVRWVETIRAMASLGMTAALEAGPGKVLAGLTKRIAPEIQVHAAGTAEEIADAIERLKVDDSDSTG